MADYFTHFACLLDTGSTENVVKARAIYRDYADELNGEDLSIAFAQRCGQALGLTGRWGFQYAHTCSRPRIDGFIPSFADWVKTIRPEPWMGRAQRIAAEIEPPVGIPDAA